jgi:hypothetical protein
MRWTAVLLGGALLIGSAPLLWAQSQDMRTIVPVTVTVNPADFDPVTGVATVTFLGATEIEIRANRAFLLEVRSLSQNFSHVPLPGWGTTVKPAADLEVDMADGWVTVGLNPVQVMSRPRTSGYDTFAVNLRYTGYLSDSPGEYTLTLEFILTVP